MRLVGKKMNLAELKARGLTGVFSSLQVLPKGIRLNKDGTVEQVALYRLGEEREWLNIPEECGRLPAENVEKIYWRAVE